jgi:hypothetical protein
MMLMQSALLMGSTVMNQNPSKIRACRSLTLSVGNGLIQKSPGCAGYWRIGTIGVARQSSQSYKVGLGLGSLLWGHPFYFADQLAVSHTVTEGVRFHFIMHPPLSQPRSAGWYDVIERLQISR